MNSLDAILSITVLLAGFGIILIGINSANTSFLKTNNTLAAKTSAIACATILDSMYSNSASEFISELNCTPKESTLSATVKDTTKTSQTTTTAIKELTIEVKTLDHYFE